MKFALFYEIPVARPWDSRSEYVAYQNTIEQAVLGDRMGFDSFWTVEHHFLEEYSHCSNPEVLYGAVAARTERIRIGYGVRLMPAPYNHPIRSAESAAVLDLISGGRVEFGAGRSSTRAELEGFGINPHETRQMWEEALTHIVGAWTEDVHSFEGKYWQMPPRRVLPKPMQSPHPPLWGATSSPDGHRVMGEAGVGLCSFTVGLPPEELAARLELYRDGLANCTKPIGKFVNSRAATFTMVHCAPTQEEADAVARESFEWYPQHGARLIASVGEWLEGQDYGTYEYTRETLQHQRDGHFDFMTYEYLRDSGSAVVGDPDACIAAAKRYEAAGCDLLLCLFNPYKMPHDKVMQSIELMGRYVLPQFA